MTAMTLAVQSALDSHVLVLNKHYAAVRVVTARRAISLLVRQIAEILTVDEEDPFTGQGGWQSYDFESWRELSELRAEYERDAHEWIHGVRFDLAVPRIIRLLFYDRLPKRPVKFNRRNIFARDHNRCQYCGRRYPVGELSLDHVMPRSRGGHANWTNIVCCCITCNVRKGGRTPAEAGMKLISEPMRPRRSPVVTLRLSSEKYASWKHFLDNAYWNVELRD
jgi:5-methylcytosine-specific restriction endonuclease McrA